MSDDMDLPGMWSNSDFTGGDPDERSHTARRWSTGFVEREPCRLGRIEYDGARYCHEHGGFLEPGVQSLQCDRARHVRTDPLCALHRPPETGSERDRFERQRGIACPVCTDDEEWEAS